MRRPSTPRGTPYRGSRTNCNALARSTCNTMSAKHRRERCRCADRSTPINNTHAASSVANDGEPLSAARSSWSRAGAESPLATSRTSSGECSRVGQALLRKPPPTHRKGNCRGKNRVLPQSEGVGRVGRCPSVLRNEGSSRNSPSSNAGVLCLISQTLPHDGNRHWAENAGFPEELFGTRLINS